MDNPNTRWWAILFVLILCVWVSILRNSEAERLANELTKQINPSAVEIQQLATQVEKLNRLAVNHHNELVELINATKSQGRVDGRQREHDIIAEGGVRQEPNKESPREGAEVMVLELRENTNDLETLLDEGVIDTFHEDVASYRQLMSPETKQMIANLKKQAIETIIKDSEAGHQLTDQQIQSVVIDAENDPSLKDIVKALDDAIVGQMMIDEVYKGIKPDLDSFSFSPTESKP